MQCITKIKVLWIHSDDLSVVNICKDEAFLFQLIRGLGMNLSLLLFVFSIVSAKKENGHDEFAELLEGLIDFDAKIRSAERRIEKMANRFYSQSIGYPEFDLKISGDFLSS